MAPQPLQFTSSPVFFNGLIYLPLFFKSTMVLYGTFPPVFVCLPLLFPLLQAQALFHFPSSFFPGLYRGPSSRLVSPPRHQRSARTVCFPPFNSFFFHSDLLIFSLFFIFPSCFFLSSALPSFALRKVPTRKDFILVLRIGTVFSPFTTPRPEFTSLQFLSPVPPVAHVV